MQKNLIILLPDTATLERRVLSHLESITRKYAVTEAQIIKIDPTFTTLETKEQKEHRLNTLYPLLQSKLVAGADNQLVAMGQWGARALAGGDPSETSMIGDTRIIQDWNVAFTYGMEHYADPEEKGGKEDARILEHIDTTIKASSAPVFETSNVCYRSWLGVEGYDWSRLVLDVETNGTDLPYYGTKITLIGLRPVGSNVNILLTPEQIDDHIREFLRKNVKLVIGHNVGFDLLFMRSLGVEFPAAKLHDTMIFHKSFDLNEWWYGLKYLLKRDYGFPHYDTWFSERIHLFKKKKASLSEYDEADFAKLCTYNCGDLIGTEKLYTDQIVPRNFQQVRVPFSVEMDYQPYVLRMIHNGMYVDTDRLSKISEDTGDSLEGAMKIFAEKYGIGEGFNIDSSAQVKTLLAENGLKVKSTGKDVLEAYKADHEIVRDLLNIRNLSKLLRTSTGKKKDGAKSKKKGFKDYIDANKLVHSTVNVHGAETGRSTSSAPNLQNTDPRVRECFISRYEGGRLISTDLSGIEYRLIGHASEDRILLDVFNLHKDIHDEMYLFLFGEYPPDKKRRKKAKTANFCGVYGGGYKKFILSAGLEDNKESRRLYEAAKNRYKGVLAWKERVREQLERHGFVRNLFGRVRYFPVVNEDMIREAINWIIQSSGHDVLKIYSMELNDRLADAGLTRTLLVSEIHDSNTFDSPADEWEKATEVINGLAKDLNGLIEECYGVRMKVPIFAETEVLERWA